MGKKEKVEKISIEEIARYADGEGIGYAVQCGIGVEDIADPLLAELWRNAHDALEGLERVLKEHLVEEEFD